MLFRIQALILASSFALTTVSDVSATVIFKEDFEDTCIINSQTERCWDAEDHKRDETGSNPLQQFWSNVFKFSQMQYEFAGRVVSYLDGGIKPRKGSGAMRFTWQQNKYDPDDDNNTKKAHLWTNWESPSVKGQSRWYGFSMYMPSRNNLRDSDSSPYSFSMAPDNEPEILVQWHGKPNQTEYANGNLYPPLSMKHKGNTIYFEWWYDSNETTTKPLSGDSGDGNNKFYDPVGAVYDKWVDWMFYVRWNPNGSGLLEIHRKIIDPTTNTGEWVRILQLDNIRIGYNDDSDPQVGLGIYKYTARSDYSSRRVYFDEFTISTTQDEVKP
jgi:Polysaccharide lyase